MKYIFTVLIVALVSVNCGKGPKDVSKRAKGDGAELLYQKNFGNDNSKETMIFIHDGPGSDSSSFEDTTAERLNKELGYNVIVYDQRGQGRSKVTKLSNYNYRKYSEDLNNIITTRKIKNPILLGYGHGGIIAMKFDAQYPNVAKSIVLVSTPMNYWTSLEQLHTQCDENYKAKGSSADLQKDLDDRFRSLTAKTRSASQLGQDLKKVLNHANTCELSTPLKPTAKATGLKAKIKKQQDIDTDKSTEGFLDELLRQNQDYTKNLSSGKGRYYGIYGKEDKLFTEDNLKGIKEAVEPSRFELIDEASHAVFIDQQDKFLEALKKLLN